MKGVPFEDFFSVTPSKIGISYKKLTATFLSKLSVFFLLVTGVSKQELLFSLRTF